MQNDAPAQAVPSVPLLELLFQMPPLILEQILRMAAISDEPKSSAFTIRLGRKEAKDLLHGLQSSCHAGRNAVSSLISTSTITLDGRQAHGPACGLPLAAARMRKLVVQVDRMAAPSALSSLLAEPRMRGMLARLQELEVETMRPPFKPFADGKLAPPPPPAPLDLAAVASACPPSLLRLKLALPAPGAAQSLAPLSSLVHLPSLELSTEYGDLDATQLSHLTPLTALTRLTLLVQLATAAGPLYPQLAALRSLCHLRVIYYDRTARMSFEPPSQESMLRVLHLSALSALDRLSRLELIDHYNQAPNEDEDEEDEEGDDVDGGGDVPFPRLPLERYLAPFTRLRQLTHLCLTELSLTSVDGIALLRASLPLLCELTICGLTLPLADPDAPPEAAPPPSQPPLADGAFRCLSMHLYEGSLAALLCPPLWAPRIEVTGDMQLELGPASSTADVAVAAEHLARLADVLRVTRCLELVWDAPGQDVSAEPGEDAIAVPGEDVSAVPGEDVSAAPGEDVSAAPVVLALAGPLGQQLRGLQLREWRVDEAVMAAVAAVVPGLERLGFLGDTTTVSDGAWVAMAGLTALQDLQVACKVNYRAMGAYAGSAPSLENLMLSEPEQAQEEDFKVALHKVFWARRARGLKELSLL